LQRRANEGERDENDIDEDDIESDVSGGSKPHSRNSSRGPSRGPSPPLDDPMELWSPRSPKSSSSAVRSSKSSPSTIKYPVAGGYSPGMAIYRETMDHEGRDPVTIRSPKSIQLLVIPNIGQTFNEPAAVVLATTFNEILASATKKLSLNWAAKRLFTPTGEEIFQISEVKTLPFVCFYLNISTINHSQI